MEADRGAEDNDLMQATEVIGLRIIILALVLLLLPAAAAEAPERPRWVPTPPLRVAAPAGVPETGGTNRLLVEATGYSHECGNGDGVTATGTIPRPGVVSVDPAVIPLGTELWVEGYGPGRAEDTGGLIKGQKIDLFFESEAQALEWGRRMVEVRVIE